MKTYALIALMLLMGLMMAAVGSTQAQELLPYPCYSAPIPRLISGQSARVTPGLPNLLRSQPSRNWTSQIIGQIPADGIFTVMDGYSPQCGDGMYWWFVNYNGMLGWTPEGSNTGVYWTEPYGLIDGCSVGSRMIPGMLARVPLHMSQVLRFQPGGDESTVLTYVPNGGVVTVQYGYAGQCAQNMWWYYVNYNNVMGWLPEGMPGNYWLEPYGPTTDCGANLPPRLNVGGWGRVTPGLPNNVRSQPSIRSPRVSMIPSGGLFEVVDGPVCSNSIIWWRVRFMGVTGWTGEGRAGVYWLAPQLEG